MDSRGNRGKNNLHINFIIVWDNIRQEDRKDNVQ